MERRTLITRILEGVITLGLVLFCMGLAPMDAQAKVDWITIAGEKYSKSHTLTHNDNPAIQSGTVIYSTKTDSITLDNAHIVVDASNNSNGIYLLGGVWFPDWWFDVYLIGDSTITMNSDNYAIDSIGVNELKIHGPGTLTIETQSTHAGIFMGTISEAGEGDLTIDGGATVHVHGNGAEYGIDLNCANDDYGMLEIKDSTLIVDGTQKVGLNIFVLQAENSVVDVTATDQGVYADGGGNTTASIIKDSTVTIKATGADGSGMHIGGLASNNKFKVEGSSEITISGAKEAIEKGLFAKHMILEASDSNPMKFEVASDTSGSDPVQVGTYDTKTTVDITSTVSDKEIRYYPYLHISAEGTMDVQVGLQMSVPEGVTAPATVKAMLYENGKQVGSAAELTAATSTGTITGVPKRAGSTYQLRYELYDENGSQIPADNYDVDVIKKAADSYQIVVSGSAQHVNMDVTAVVKPTSGAGTPDSIELTLTSNVEGEEPRTMTLTAADNWKGTFQNLIKENTYTLEVTAIHGGNGGYVADVVSPDKTYALVFISGGNVPESGSSIEAGECNHVYEWEIYKAATATEDGIMRYRCKYCGDVEYEVPTAAYYVFNKDTQELIQKAAQGATVNVETPIFISFHEMVKDALIERPDVTLVVTYKNEGKTYEMTIPAGSGETLTTLFGDSQYAGFLYLGGAFATVEK